MNPGASPHSRAAWRQRRGQAAESVALGHLESLGLICLARNVRYRVGELDLVMRHGTAVVFVEVRYRSPSRFGSAAASVDRGKRQRLSRAAQCWILKNFPGPIPPLRFDVVAIDGGRIQWMMNAFGVGGAL